MLTYGPAHRPRMRRKEGLAELHKPSRCPLFADAAPRERAVASSPRMTASSYMSTAIRQTLWLIFAASQQVSARGKGGRVSAVWHGIRRPSFFSLLYHEVNWWAGQDSNLQPDRYERPALTIELPARGRTLGVVRSDRHNRRGVQLSGCATGGMARGRPLSSMATKVKVAKVTFSRRVVWKRWAKASMLIFMEVRPMLSTWV